MQETEKMRVWSPESGRPAGGGHGNSLQYSCLENPHGQRSLAGYSPQGHTEWDLTLDNGNVQPMLRAAVLLNNVDTPETNNTLKKQVSRNSGLWPVNPEDWPDKLTRQMLPAIKLMCSWVCMWEHMGAHTHTHIHTHTHPSACPSLLWFPAETGLSAPFFAQEVCCLHPSHSLYMMLQEINSSRKETVNFEIHSHPPSTPAKKKRQGQDFLLSSRPKAVWPGSPCPQSHTRADRRSKRAPFHTCYVTPSDKQHQTAYKTREERW